MYSKFSSSGFKMPDSVQNTLKDKQKLSLSADKLQKFSKSPERFGKFGVSLGR
jgi:hypothetical protein